MHATLTISSFVNCKMPQDIRMKLAMLAKSDESYRAAIQQVLMDKSGELERIHPDVGVSLEIDGQVSVSSLERL